MKHYWDFLKHANDLRTGLIMWGPVFVGDFVRANAEDCYGNRRLINLCFGGNKLHDYKFKKLRLLYIEVKDKSFDLIEDFGWHKIQSDPFGRSEYNVVGKLLYINEMTVGKCSPPSWVDEAVQTLPIGSIPYT
jgi:hypothetical protein